MIQQILMLFFMSLVFSTLVGWVLGRQLAKRYEHEKQIALKQLADSLGSSHTITHNFLIELQAVIYRAKDLGEIRRYLQGKSDDFIRSLRPCKVVPLPTKQDDA